MNGQNNTVSLLNKLLQYYNNERPRCCCHLTNDWLTPDILQVIRQVAAATRSFAVSTAATCSVKDNFHYRDPTGPTRTRTDPRGPARTRTTRISEKLRWSVRVSDKVRWVRSISTCKDFVRGSGRVRDTVGALKKLKHRRSLW